MASRIRAGVAIGWVAAAVLGGCAADQKVSTAGKVRLSAAREPFTFSSWDVGRVEWSAPPSDAAAVPPDAAAVLASGAVVPLRTLTLATARATPGLAVGPAGRLDDGHGVVYDTATPVTGSGFRFDFAGDRLVHFLATGYDQNGTTLQPVFQARTVDKRDENGDPRRYAMPLDHDGCTDLFGGAQGLETDFSLPSF